MPKATMKVLRPSYYTRFSCIGSACEDNCCHSWRIGVDKNTYKRYRGIRDPEWSGAFSSCLKRNTELDGQPGADYAWIKLLEDGTCPFLDGDRLCRIQKELGYDYLSAVCKIYPRIRAYLLKDIFEHSLYLSCPEAVRVALFPEEPMTFEMAEIRVDANDPTVRQAVNRIVSGAPLAEYAWSIREGCIDIMQSRNMPVAGRIFAVGMLLSRIGEHGRQGETEKIMPALNAFGAMAREGAFVSALSDLEENPEAQSGMQSIIIRSAFLLAAQSSRSKGVYRQFLNEVASWPQGEEDRQLSYLQIYGRVRESTEEHWLLFLRERSHILENYFVNYIFSSLFPFKYAPGLDIYGHFLLLAEQYAMFRLIFSVIAGKQGGVTDGMIVEIIQAVSNNAQNESTSRQIAKQYTDAGVDSLVHMALLLRD